jgi:hypothetical protein
MKKNTNKFITNLLTTASALAVLAGGAMEAQGAAAQVVQTDSGGTIANLNTGLNLIDTANAGVAFVNNDSIILNVGDAIRANKAGGTTISAINITGAPQVQGLLINTNTNLGSVNGTDLMNVFMQSKNQTLTLTGTASVGTMPIPNTVNADTYAKLGAIDFNNLTTNLTIQASSNASLTLDNATVTKAGNATLNAQTSLVVKNTSFAGIKNFQIGAAKSLTFDVGQNAITTIADSTYTFDSGDSTLIYKVDLAGGAKSLTLGNNIAPTVAADESFKIEINATGGAAALTVTGAGGVKNIGNAPNNRAKELKLSGNKDITFTDQVNVFAKSIIQAGAGTTTFTNALDSGDNSSLTYSAGGNVNLLGNTTITNIDFTNNAGTLALGANVTLTGAIKSTATPNGTLNILGTGTTITGAIGTLGNEVATINVGLLDGAEAGTTFGSSVNATTLNVGGAGNVNVGGTKGTLTNVVGATKVTTLQVGGIGAAGGNGQGGEGVATFAGTLDAATINVGGAGIATKGAGGDGTATFNGAISHVGGVTINVGGAIGGAIAGGLGRANFNHNVGTGVDVATIDYKADNSVITFGGIGMKITGTIDDTTGKANTQLIIQGGDTTNALLNYNVITGAVGASNAIGALSVGNNATNLASGAEAAAQFNAAVKATNVTIGGTGLVANKGGKGTVIFDQAFDVLNAIINVGGAGSGTDAQGIGGEGVATFTGAVGAGNATTIKVGGASNTAPGGKGTVFFADNVGAGGNLATILFRANESSITLTGAGKTITGTIDNTALIADTKLNIFGGLVGTKNTITGAVGATEAIAEIYVGQDAVIGLALANGANGAIKFNNAVKANYLQIGGHASAANSGGIGNAIFDTTLNADAIRIGGNGQAGQNGGAGTGTFTGNVKNVANNDKAEMELGGSTGAVVTNADGIALFAGADNLVNIIINTVASKVQLNALNAQITGTIAAAGAVGPKGILDIEALGTQIIGNIGGTTNNSALTTINIGTGSGGGAKNGATTITGNIRGTTLNIGAAGNGADNGATGALTNVTGTTNFTTINIGGDGHLGGGHGGTGAATFTDAATIDTLNIGGTTNGGGTGGAGQAAFKNNVTINTAVNFKEAASILTLNSLADDDKTFTLDGGSNVNAVVGNGGVVNLNAVNNLGESNLVVTGGSLGNGDQLTSVNVTGDGKIHVISDINTVLLTIGAGSTLNFTPISANTNLRNITLTDAASALTLIATDGNQNTFVLNNDVVPGGAGRGIITLFANGDDANFNPIKSKVILDGSAINRKLGDGVNTIAQLIADGDGLSVITSNINLNKVLALDVKTNANLTVQTATLNSIPTITIEDGGSLTYDAASLVAAQLRTNAVNFGGNESLLVLTNTSPTLGGANRAITLQNVLAPGAATDLQGNLQIISGPDKTLTVGVANGATIGTDDTHRLGTLIVSGAQTATINPAVFAQFIKIDNTKEVIFGGAIDSGVGDGLGNNLENFSNIQVLDNLTDGIKFNQNTKVEYIFPADKTFTMTVGDGKILSVDHIGNAPNNVSLILGDDAQLKGHAGGAVNNIFLTKLTLDDRATLKGGNFTIGEVRSSTQAGGGNGGAINLDNGFNLTGGINTGGGAAANFNFAGNGLVTGDIGSNNAAVGRNLPIVNTQVGTITVAGGIANNNTKTLELRGAVINAAGIDGTTGYEILQFSNAAPTLVQTTNPIGQGGALLAIEFNGTDDVYIANSTVVPNLGFLTASDITVSIPNTDFTNIKIFNNSGDDRNYKLVVGGRNVVFGQKVSEANFFGGVIMATNDKITVGSEVFNAYLEPRVNGEGEVRIVGNNVYHGRIGLSTQKFNKVTFAEDADVWRIYSNNIEIEDGKTATFIDARNNEAKFTNMKLTGSGTATFQADFAGGAIDGDGGNNGTVNFENTATIAHNLGAGVKLAAVNFNANTGEDISLKANIKAGTIAFKKSDLTVEAAVADQFVLEGATTFTNTNIILGENDLEFKTGAVTLSDVKINTTVADTNVLANAGNLIAGAGSDFLAIPNSLTIIVDNDDVGPINDQRFIVVKNSGGTTTNISLDKIKLQGTNEFASWSAKRDTASGDIYLINASQVEEVLTEDSKDISDSIIPKDSARIFENSGPGTQGFEIVKEWSTMSKDSRNDSRARLLNSNDTQVTEVTNNVIDNIQNDISSRIGNFVTFTPVFISGPQAQTISSISSPAPSVAARSIAPSLSGTGMVAPTAKISAPTGGGVSPAGSGAGIGGATVQPTGSGTAPVGTTGAAPTTGSKTTAPSGTTPSGGTGTDVDNKAKTKKTSDSSTTFSGMAAGDDPARYGLWGSPIYSDATQGTTNNAAGYRAKSVGMTFGFDTKANDDMIIGAALSFVRSEAKYKGYKSGDKTQMEALLLSIYGVQQFTDQVFGQAVFTFASTRVHNRENRRNTNTTTQLAHGRYSSTSFGAEVLGGYNHVINNKYVITPMVGLDYKHINDNRYTETGTSVQNRTITKKALDKVDLVAGIRFSCAPFLINEMDVTPEIHGFVKQDLTNKVQKVDIGVDVGPGDDIVARDKAKPARTHGTIGAGLNASYNMVEGGISYDLSLAKKFVGHQGALKLRVNF